MHAAPLVAVSEYFLSPDAINPSKSTPTDPIVAGLSQMALSRLKIVGQSRVKDMRTAGISFQVLSHIPMPSSLSPRTCRAVNDSLEALIRALRDKFAAVALLPISQPSEAASELARCVRNHKFVGAAIPSMVDNAQVPCESLAPVFAAAEQLGIPLFLQCSDLHGQNQATEAFAPETTARADKSDLMHNFEAHSQTALQILHLHAAGKCKENHAMPVPNIRSEPELFDLCKLVTKTNSSWSGLFDRYPRIKLVIGHAGELLPAFLDSSIATSNRIDSAKSPVRKIKDVFQTNIWVVTAHTFSLAPVAALLQFMPADKILFGIGYPLVDNESGTTFIQLLKESSLVNEEQFELIVHRNAEDLFGIKVPSSSSELPHPVTKASEATKDATAPRVAEQRDDGLAKLPEFAEVPLDSENKTKEKPKAEDLHKTGQKLTGTLSHNLPTAGAHGTASAGAQRWKPVDRPPSKDVGSRTNALRGPASFETRDSLLEKPDKVQSTNTPASSRVQTMRERFGQVGASSAPLDGSPSAGKPRPTQKLGDEALKNSVSPQDLPRDEK
jgi:predicted TIM-barrel fold metal-dependent hydrolase